MSDHPGVPSSGSANPGGASAAQLLGALRDLVRATYAVAQTTQAASGDLLGSFPGPITVTSTHLVAPLPLAQGGTGNATGQPSGVAGGDLSGFFPNPAIEIGAVSNLKLANSSITLSAGANVGLTVPGLISLGAIGFIGSVNDTPRFAGLGLGGNAGGANTLKIYGSGSGAVTLSVPAAAGATAQTLPAIGGTVLIATATQAANGLFVTPFRLTDFHDIDGTALSAAASAGKFGFAITLGTSAALVGEAAQGNTKTSDAIIEAILPPWFVAGSNLTATTNAKLTGAGIAGTHTALIKAWRTASDGSQGADLGPGIAVNITAGGADIPFAIAGASLNPGDRIIFELETVLQETGGAATITAIVNSMWIS